MTIIPSQIATMGLYPGWEPFMAATLGHWFEFRIEIEPIQHGTDASVTELTTTRLKKGGSPGHPIITDCEEIYDSRRLVRVTVRYKSKEWQQEIKMETISINKIQVIVNKLISIKERSIEIKARFVRRIKSVFAIASIKK